MSQVDKDKYHKEREFLHSLLVACEKDDLAKVKELEKSLARSKPGVSILRYRDGNKASVIHAAARGGARRTLEYLLNMDPTQGALKDASGKTPLIAAVSSEQGAPCVDYLLTHNSFAKDSIGESCNGTQAIHLASALDLPNPLASLLQAGHPDPNAASEAGRPLHWAAGHASNGATTKVLLDTGKVDVNALDDKGCTPLILACLRGVQEIVKLVCAQPLVKYDIFAHNLSALGAACVSGSIECITLILEHGGESLCMVRDPVEHLLPIEIAAHAGQEAVVDLLAAKSGMENVNAKQLVRDIQDRFEREEDQKRQEQQEADQLATVTKDQGNALFLEKDYVGAIAKYEQARQVPKVSAGFQAACLSNISACQLKAGSSEKAIQAAQTATECDPTFMKGFYRLGQAYSSVQDHESAAKAYWDGHQVNKASKESKQYLALFRKEIDAGKRKHAAKASG